MAEKKIPETTFKGISEKAENFLRRDEIFFHRKPDVDKPHIWRQTRLSYLGPETVTRTLSYRRKKIQPKFC